jgi:hypothetical protein
MSTITKLQAPSNVDDETPHSSLRTWGTTRAERELGFPIDAQLGAGGRSLFRGITIGQSPEVVWTWLGQLRLAPYSYDWLDNGFRRSPRRLVELPAMAVGDPLMVWLRVTQVDPLRSFTAGCRSFADLLPRQRLFHKMVQKPGFVLFNLEWVGLSYQLCALGPQQTRLLVKLRWKCRSNLLAPLTYLMFELADFVMMRRQLLNLKALAEGSEG